MRSVVFDMPLLQPKSLINLLAKLGEVRRICLPSLGLRPRDGRQILLTSPRFARRLVPDYTNLPGVICTNLLIVLFNELGLLGS